MHLEAQGLPIPGDGPAEFGKQSGLETGLSGLEEKFNLGLSPIPTHTLPHSTAPWTK